MSCEKHNHDSDGSFCPFCNLEDPLRSEIDDLMEENKKLFWETAEQQKQIKEQGESIGALMAKGISDCTARDKTIVELNGTIEDRDKAVGDLLDETKGQRDRIEELEERHDKSLKGYRVVSERAEAAEKRVREAIAGIRVLPRYFYDSGEITTTVIPLTATFDLLDKIAPTTEETIEAEMEQEIEQMERDNPTDPEKLDPKHWAPTVAQLNKHFDDPTGETPEQLAKKAAEYAASPEGQKSMTDAVDQASKDAKAFREAGKLDSAKLQQPLMSTTGEPEEEESDRCKYCGGPMIAEDCNWHCFACGEPPAPTGDDENE